MELSYTWKLLFEDGLTILSTPKIKTQIIMIKFTSMLKGNINEKFKLTM